MSTFADQPYDESLIKYANWVVLDPFVSQDFKEEARAYLEWVSKLDIWQT